MASMGDILDGMVIGLHLVSAHSADGFNNSNAGIFVRTEAGLTAGAYENSLSRTTMGGNNGRRRISSYAGWTWQTPRGGWALTLGGVTGYGHSEMDVCVERSEFGGFGCARHEHLDAVPNLLPLAVVSGRLSITNNWSARLAYMYVPTSTKLHVGNLIAEYQY